MKQWEKGCSGKFLFFIPFFFFFGFQLSDKRKVTIQDFKGKTLVSIREYFKKEGKGKELPTSKGTYFTCIVLFL